MESKFGLLRCTEV
jgi:hypothetical protein